MLPSSPKVVVCGAGLAGIAAAYHVARAHEGADVLLVDAGHPLSLTSDKSTEAYRNWWPGPDRAMTDFMNRSIDLMEAIARETGNRINLNRRGYAFATTDAAKIPFLAEMANSAEARGGGPARWHESRGSTYLPSPERGYDLPLSGADVITDPRLIRQHFAYLAPETVAVVHARRAGWLSAQQLGMVMLEASRARGVRFVRGRVVAFETAGGRVSAVQVDQDSGPLRIEATHVVLAGGPLQTGLTRMLGIDDLPIVAEPHFKVSFPDPLGGLPREAPMLIWLDAQHLPWTEDERAALAEDSSAAWLLGPFPAGVHGRPEGAGTTMILFNQHGQALAEPVFPLAEPEHYAEIALRGMATMVPGLKAYDARSFRPYVDGGYYSRTVENRPLIGPLPVEGAYVSCAYSGFGVMAACAGGELAASHVLGKPLPDYAPAFLPSRYGDPSYRALLESWGEDGQL
ncbi:MAG: dependent oxidoreductase [Enterovirga sp.]|jgi:glycine/D-amino acid oxidase-like deaminating enzyme|nr:dependent oxidoreductase [Enterovirga sp.]